MLNFSVLSQAFPPKAKFTEANVPDLTDKVCIVTGSNTGVGKEVARILYSKNASVYVACRTESKAQSAIEDIKTSQPSSKGKLTFLSLDLGDLPAVAKTADQFLAQETKLDYLFNNAGVMMPGNGTKTKQGYEMQLGINCVGHFLFTKKLTPLLQASAKTSPAGSTRVMWVASSAAEAFAPACGVDMTNLDYHTWRPNTYQYGVSKAGNYFQSMEYGKRFGDDGIVSVSMNPGNLKSDLGRTAGFLGQNLHWLFSYPVVNGAYTELYAAFSPEVKNRDWVIPFGRQGSISKSLQDNAKDESEGGKGTARKFWEWLEEQVKEYV